MRANTSTVHVQPLDSKRTVGPAGVPSVESDVILDVIAALPADIAVLIIEHDMDVVFRFAKEITVLVDGGVLTSGPPEEIAANPEVKAVYLGEESHG